MGDLQFMPAECLFPWLKGELVHFFRQATEGDYLEALTAAQDAIADRILNPPRVVCKNGADWALPTADEFPEITNDPPMYGEIIDGKPYTNQWGYPTDLRPSDEEDEDISHLLPEKYL